MVTLFYAFLWGMKRALFSNEAGQGSAPIAHAAAKTDEPIREAQVRQSEDEDQIQPMGRSEERRRDEDRDQSSGLQ